MISAIPDILSRVVESKREALARGPLPVAEWERRVAEQVGSRRDFRAALLGRTPAIIAEMKKASPSKGVLAENFEPRGIAQAYQRGGAAALSVLTDEPFFQGKLADLETARAAVGIPVLRKDFTIVAEHVLEAAAHGADAVLLIAAILTERELRDFREAAARYRMAALVEVHDGGELERAIAAGSQIIGVNNRDLRSFQVSLDTSLRLAERMPAGVVRVSESGIHTAADVRKLREAGYAAFLVGERLMKAADPAAALAELVTS